MHCSVSWLDPGLASGFHLGRVFVAAKPGRTSSPYRIQCARRRMVLDGLVIRMIHAGDRTCRSTSSARLVEAPSEVCHGAGKTALAYGERLTTHLLT